MLENSLKSVVCYKQCCRRGGGGGQRQFASDPQCEGAPKGAELFVSFALKLMQMPIKTQITQQVPKFRQVIFLCTF